MKYNFGMRKLLLVLLIIKPFVGALAAEPVVVRQGLKGDEGYAHENLKGDTVVKHYQFDVTVPSGWSFWAQGDNDKNQSSIEISPTSRKPSPTSTADADLTVACLKRAPQKNLEERYKMYRTRYLDWNIEYKTWNGQKWLVSQYEKNGATNWLASTIHNGRDYVVFASLPLSESKKSTDFKKIMESISIH
jgi:hypothetical protein